MTNCCTKEYYTIGTFSNCGQINTGLIAAQGGIYTILFEYKGKENSFRVFAAQGDEIIIFNLFAEDADTKIRIINPDGSQFEYNHYNCINATCETYNVFLISTIPYNKFIIECDECCPVVENLTTC